MSITVGVAEVGRDVLTGAAFLTPLTCRLPGYMTARSIEAEMAWTWIGTLQSLLVPRTDLK